MAKFLNTTATNYQLEELIKHAEKHVILVSPFLQLSTRIKELLEDKNRSGVAIRIVYGKSQLKREEKQWLESREHIEVRFCKNLHAKCYLSEKVCIITSMNLYEFSQVNNNEMGVLIERGRGGILGSNPDNKLYDDVYDEVKRLLRISKRVRSSKQTETTPVEASSQSSEVVSNAVSKESNVGAASPRLSASGNEKTQKIAKAPASKADSSQPPNQVQPPTSTTPNTLSATHPSEDASAKAPSASEKTSAVSHKGAADAKGEAKATKNYSKLTTAKLAAHLNMEVFVLRERLRERGYIEMRDNRPYLTDEGKGIGAELRKSPRGYFVLWPKDLIV